MYYKVEFDVEGFEFWAGAKDRMDDATEEQKREVAERIEEVFDNTIPEDVEINDFVWFECDDIFFPEEDEETEEEEENEDE